MIGLKLKRVILIAAIFVLALVVAGISVINSSRPTHSIKKVAVSKVKKKKTTKSKVEINWQKASENKPYPDVKKYPKMWIKVSKKKQRTYLMNGKKVLYTMYCSTGENGKNATPAGTFAIQKERGEFFYNHESGEGAKYWVSWKDHGVYLFHSVPTDVYGKFDEKQAKFLGKKANSHGCVRLSVPDSQWLYQNAKEGTKVVITNK